MAHLIKLFESFQLVGDVSLSQQIDRKGQQGKDIENLNKSKEHCNQPSNYDCKSRLICFNVSHKEKGSLHLLKHCTACLERKKKAMSSRR